MQLLVSASRPGNLSLVIGLGVSLFGAAFIAVLAVGDDPPNSVVGILMLRIYLAGAIALFIWCKL